MSETDEYETMADWNAWTQHMAEAERSLSEAVDHTDPGSTAREVTEGLLSIVSWVRRFDEVPRR